MEGWWEEVEEVEEEEGRVGEPVGRVRDVQVDKIGG